MPFAVVHGAGHKGSRPHSRPLLLSVGHGSAVAVKAPAPIRVAIVDDHVLVPEALRELLERNGEFEVVGIASSAEDGLRTVTETMPDVVLMDVRPPDGSGIDLAALS